MSDNTISTVSSRQPGPFEKIDQALQLIVRVVKETREGFLGSGTEAPLIVRNVIPGGNARVARREFGVGRRNPDRLLAREPFRPHRVPPGVVPAAMARHVVRGDVIGKVTGTERQVQEERHVGGGHDVVPDEVDGLIDQVLRQVITAGLVRIDGMAVAEQFRVPVVRRRAEKAVPVIETAPRRPLVERTRRVPPRHRRQVPLSDGITAVTARVQEFGQGPYVVAYPTPVPGMVTAPFGNVAHARGMGVHTGQQARPGRRAQRGNMEVVVAQAMGGETVHAWRGHLGPIAAEVAETHVVEHDQDDVRLAAALTTALTGCFDRRSLAAQRGSRQQG